MKNSYKSSGNDYTILICKILDSIKLFASRKNIDLNVYSDKSVAKFMSLPVDVQAAIVENFSSWEMVLSQLPLKKEISDMDVASEVQMLQKALKLYGLKSPEDNWDFLEKGDIIEIYNLSDQQIYRNFELLKICPYDTLTLVTHEWSVLCDRAQSVTNKISSELQRLAHSDTTERVAFQVPLHVMKCSMSPFQETFEITFKWGTPLFCEQTGEKTAFLLTQSGSPLISEKEEAKNLHMLKKR